MFLENSVNSPPSEPTPDDISYKDRPAHADRTKPLITLSRPFRRPEHRAQRLDGSTPQHVLLLWVRDPIRSSFAFFAKRVNKRLISVEGTAMATTAVHRTGTDGVAGSWPVS